MPRRAGLCRSSSRKFKQQTLFDILDSSPSSPLALFPKSPSAGLSMRKRTREISSSSDSDEAQDTDGDVGAIRFESEVVRISEEDCSPRRPKKRTSLGGAHDIPKRASSDESLGETIAAPRQRKGKRKVVLDSDDDSLPRKRKLVKGMRPPTPEGVEDDILDAENQVLESRLRSRDKMSAFRKNLEKLKMLKGKKRSEISLESSSPEAEQSESLVEAPFKGAKPHHSGESDASHDESNDSEDEDDFIVDDDVHGAPATQLPAAFSLSTHQDLIHHFKIICQLFVHVAVQPLANRRPFLERALKEEEYLSVPLQVTRRKLSGMRDSLVASSVWRSDFKKALETYPEFTLARLDFAVPECDACHLGGRVSTLEGRLSGQPYDEYDFENIPDEESDGNSEGDEDEDSDEDRERDVKAAFHLGRFCAARTRVYHQFSHWEYSLFKSLQREIVEARDKTRKFVKVAYFGGTKPPSDLHDADKVMEWLDERGIIRMEWQKMREMMDSAQNLERGEVDGSIL